MTYTTISSFGADMGAFPTMEDKMKKIILLIVPILLIFIISLYQLSHTKEMSQEEIHKALFRRFVDEAQKGNPKVADEILSPNFVLNVNGTIHEKGLAHIKQSITSTKVNFPDLEITVEHVIAEGNKLMGYWTARGTHKTFGKQVKWHTAIVSIVSGGKIVKGWMVITQLQLLTQLGYTITPPKEASE